MSNRYTYKGEIKRGENGFIYVPLSSESIRDILNVAISGNSKTGRVSALNLPVELTCDHRCECYRNKDCYACGGCYSFPTNQASYTENLKYFLTHSSDEFIREMVRQIKASGNDLFRYFTCGDIPNMRFFECMIEIAIQCPGVKFWTYTKKYRIVNKWLDAHGGVDALPENFKSIIFSHWMNRDGSYFPMENPYNMPTSEFIPYGKEDLLSTVKHVCPCSDPDIWVDCAHCLTPCYDLKPGESMGLCEHSTPQTKERDRMLKELKAQAKASGNQKLVELIAQASKLSRV